MLTFENILELFQEYLLRDPEEEVLPCKRGYVRLTWNKDSRYCVDGMPGRWAWPAPGPGFPLLRGRHPLPDPGGTV